jgi:hypothetical protein
MLIKKFNYIIFFLFIVLDGLAQKEAYFQTKIEYADFVYKKFNIDRELLNYMFIVDDTSYIMKPSILMFFKKNKFISIEKIQDKYQIYCSPKNLLKNLTIEQIEEAIMFDSKPTNILFKNFLNDTIYQETDKLTAVF